MESLGVSIISLCALQLVADSAFVTMKRFLPLSPLILHPVFACKGTQLNQLNQPFLCVGIKE